MKTFWIFLVLCIALPSTVNAKSVWLIIREGRSNGVALEKIEMEDQNQCELQGAFWISSKRIHRKGTDFWGFECLEGK